MHKKAAKGVYANQSAHKHMSRNAQKGFVARSLATRLALFTRTGLVWPVTLYTPGGLGTFTQRSITKTLPSLRRAVFWPFLRFPM